MARKADRKVNYDRVVKALESEKPLTRLQRRALGIRLAQIDADALEGWARGDTAVLAVSAWERRQISERRTR